jgi:glycosyltransferase involved in cell wall biosynthesis
MVTYNRDKFIKDAIQSILEQTFNDWEIIIIDDCSDDSTEEVVKKFIDLRIKYFKNDTNLGISRSRNKALALCKGQYVAVLDSDDYWKDVNKLKKQLEYLVSNSDCALVGTSAIVINEDGKQIKTINVPQTDGLIRNQILSINPFVHSSVMFRKDLVLECGGYDVNFEVGEDYRLWLQLGSKYKLVNFSENMVCYRKHRKNTVSNKTITALTNNIKLVKEFKNIYPNYFVAIFRRYIRLAAFKIWKFFV